MESWGIWRVVEPQLHLTVVERKKEILEEQFELLARLNEQSDDPERNRRTHQVNDSFSQPILRRS